MHQRFTNGFVLLGGILMVCTGCQVRGSVRVGGACTIDQTCLSGVCLPESQSQDGRAWIGGYCSGNCSDRDCPQGTCLKMDDGLSYCVSECTSTTDCRSNYVCSPDRKVCLPDCSLGWSCGSSLTCDRDSGACTAPKITPQPIGAPCTLNAGCQGGLCIPESSSDGGTSWTAGTCTQDCAASSSECPSGSTCFRFQDGNSRCLSSCSDSTCRQGYVCSSDAKVCLPDCRLGWSCGSSLTCETDTGECTAPKPTPQPLGAPCTLNAGCEGGLCIPEISNSSGTSWAAGTCTQDCASSPSDCPSGSTCFRFQDGNSRCLSSCSNSTCRQGYVCSSDVSVCLPDCRLGWSCANMICDKNTGECETALVPDGGARLDAARDTTLSRTDAFSPGTGGSGGGGPGPGGQGGRGGPMW